MYICTVIDKTVRKLIAILYNKIRIKVSLKNLCLVKQLRKTLSTSEILMVSKSPHLADFITTL